MIRRMGKVKSWQAVVDGMAGQRQEKELDRHEEHYMTTQQPPCCGGA